MTNLVNFIQMTGLDVDLKELADLTNTFKKRGVSIKAAQRMAVSAKLAELEEDSKQIEDAIKKARQ